MIIVDTHCDTLTKIMEQNENLAKNTCHVDLERMKRYDKFVQFFAAFIDPAYYGGNAMKRAVQIIDQCYKQINLYNHDVTLCCNYDEIMAAHTANKIAALLSIEGGEALQGDISALRIFYKLGVRSLCLTWNHRNEIADGVEDGTSKGGLTPFGREAIKEMNRLGMLVDVSHISEYGFWDVINLTSTPLIASHSNSKTICNHLRNLTDEQIIAVKNNGGVIGINLYPEFLHDTSNASITDIIKHIEHIVSLTGFDHIGLGADFDGVERLPNGINGVEDIYEIFDELMRLNYPEDFISNFAGQNFLRVFKEIF